MRALQVLKWYHSVLVGEGEDDSGAECWVVHFQGWSAMFDELVPKNDAERLKPPYSQARRRVQPRRLLSCCVVVGRRRHATAAVAMPTTGRFRTGGSSRSGSTWTLASGRTETTLGTRPRWWRWTRLAVE